MTRREVEVTIVGARGLRRVAWFGVNQPVAVAWVSPRAAKSTRVALDGGATPLWNQRLLLPVDDHLTRSVAWVLKVQVSHRPRCPLLCCCFCLHCPIGTAVIPVARILSAASSSSSSSPSPLPLLSFPLLGPLNRPHGLLDLTLRLLPAPPSSDSSPAPASPVSSSSMPSLHREEQEPPTPLGQASLPIPIPPTTPIPSSDIPTPRPPAASAPAPPPPPPPSGHLPVPTPPPPPPPTQLVEEITRPPFPTPPSRKPPPPLATSTLPIPTAPHPIPIPIPIPQDGPSSITTNHKNDNDNGKGRVKLKDDDRRGKEPQPRVDEWHDSSTFSPYDYPFYDLQHLYPIPEPLYLDPYHDDEEMEALYYLSMQSHENVKD